MKRLWCWIAGHAFTSRLGDELGVPYFDRCGRCGALQKVSMSFEEYSRLARSAEPQPGEHTP